MKHYFNNKIDLNTHSHILFTINGFNLRMDSPNQFLQELQAIHLQELQAMDAANAKEMRGYELHLRALIRHEAVMKARKLHFWGRRELEERQKQEMARAKEQEMARAKEQEMARAKEYELRKAQERQCPSRQTILHTRKEIVEQGRLYRLTMRQTACQLDDVHMIFPVITE